MHNLKITFISFVILIGFSGLAQVKEEFEKVRREEAEKKAFTAKLLFLDSAARGGFNLLARQNDSVDFLSVDTFQQKAIVIFELSQSLYTIFNDLKENGSIKNLQKLRLEGKLKVIARGIANEIELPKKTNPNQSYSNFYLKMLQKLLVQNKPVLAQDGLDYTVYQTWEKEANLYTEKEIAAFRYSFIIFLYKNYNL